MSMLYFCHFIIIRVKTYVTSTLRCAVLSVKELRE